MLDSPRPIDRPTSAVPPGLTNIAALARPQPVGRETVSRTGVWPAGTIRVTPAATRTSNRAGCGVTVGLRAGGTEVGPGESPVGAPCGTGVSNATAASDEDDVALATGRPAAGAASLLSSAKPRNAMAATATAAGARRRRCVTAVKAAPSAGRSSKGSGGPSCNSFLCLLSLGAHIRPDGYRRHQPKRRRRRP